jgi:hypothetical protein
MTKLFSSLTHGACAAIHIKGQAYHEAIGLPFLYEGIDVFPIWNAIIGIDLAQAFGAFAKSLTNGNTNVFRAEIKSKVLPGIIFF